MKVKMVRNFKNDDVWKENKAEERPSGDRHHEEDGQRNVWQNKMVPTTKKEQRQMKAVLMKKYPDRYFIDDLKEYNSVKHDLSWIDCIEEFDAFMGG